MVLCQVNVNITVTTLKDLQIGIVGDTFAWIHRYMQAERHKQKQAGIKT